MNPKLLQTFERVKAFVNGHAVNELAQAVGIRHCDEVRRSAPVGQRYRSYAHCGHVAGMICVDAPRFEQLPVEHKVGILLHEFGHVAEDHGNPLNASKTAELEADRWVFEELGIVLKYRGAKRLQWVSAADIHRFGI